LNRMAKLTKKLEITLGPSTGDLRRTQNLQAE
jgi:hypothetical protein